MPPGSGGDPSEWCKAKCYCGDRCSGNKGHQPPHRCFRH